MKKSFVLYLDQYEPIKDLTDEQKGQLLDAMFQYNCGADFEVKDPILKMAFSFFKQTFDRDTGKWLRKAEKNRENGKKGGRPKKRYINELLEEQNNPKNPDGLKETQKNPSEPKKAVSVSVSGSDSVKLVEVIDNNMREFENFWDLFNKKKDKDKCLKKWQKLTQKEKDSIFQCVSSYVQSTPDPQFRKNPLTWLNGKCWNDEIVYKLNPAEQRLQSNIEVSKEWLNER